MVNEKRKPPSKIKCEKTHPVVSFRVKKEYHERLKKLLEERNQSIGDFFRIALEVQEADSKYDERYEKGYYEGLNEAWRIQHFKVSCCNCGEPLFISNEQPNWEIHVMPVLENAFRNWRHSKCPYEKD
jgi:hypothetical protein